MPRLIPSPTRLLAAGAPPKTIEEFIGRKNSVHDQLSSAVVIEPGEWVRYAMPARA